MTETSAIIGLATIVSLGVTAQWIGRRLGFSSLLLLLPAGLLAGNLGLVDPDEMFGDTLFPLVTMLVALLLFQSGLNLRFADLPAEARPPVARLVAVGAMVTAVGTSIAVLLIVGVEIHLAVLIGAILVVSGPTVVGPLLEVIRARHPTALVLRWEGVMLDPIGATLGVVVLNVILAAGRGGVHPMLQMLARLGLGTAIGVAAAAGLVFVMSRFLVTDNMEAAVAIGFAVTAYALGEVLLSESGLIAAVTVGVVAANQRVVPTARISGFGETLEVLIIGMLFIVLGALVELSALVDVAWRAAVLVVVLVLVVRPLTVAVSLAGSSLPWQDRALAGWLDPRGIVAAATAAQFSGTLADAGTDASIVTPLVFAVILGTGLVYGLTTPLVAHVLRVSDPPPKGVALVGHSGWVDDLAGGLQQLGATVLLLTRLQADDRKVVQGVRVVSIRETETRLDALLDEASIGQALVASEPGGLLTLVVADLIEELGRRNVYRLPVHTEGPVERLMAEAWSPQAFTDGITFTDVEALVSDGATVEVFDGALPPSAVPLAMVHDDGSVDLAPGIEHSARQRRRARRGPRPVGSVALVAAQPHADVGDRA